MASLGPMWERPAVGGSWSPVLEHQPPFEPPFRACHLTTGPTLINQGSESVSTGQSCLVSRGGGSDWKSGGDPEGLGQMRPQDIAILLPSCSCVDMPQHLPASPGGQGPLCLALNSGQASWGAREGGYCPALCPLPLSALSLRLGPCTLPPGPASFPQPVLPLYLGQLSSGPPGGYCPQASGDMQVMGYQGGTSPPSLGASCR